MAKFNPQKCHKVMKVFERLIAGIVKQRRIQTLVKHLQWSFLRKQSTVVYSIFAKSFILDA